MHVNVKGYISINPPSHDMGHVRLFGNQTLECSILRGQYHIGETCEAHDLDLLLIELNHSWVRIMTNCIKISPFVFAELRLPT